MPPNLLCLRQLLSFLTMTTSTLILTVPGATDECVFERVEKSNKLQGSFEVVSGVGEVIASVYGPSGELHFNSDKAKSNRLNVMAPMSGLYKLCLTNRDRDEKSVAVSPPFVPCVQCVLLRAQNFATTPLLCCSLASSPLWFLYFPLSLFKPSFFLTPPPPLLSLFPLFTRTTSSSPSTSVTTCFSP